MGDAPAASFGTIDLDQGMIELIKPELAPGERLLWASRSHVRTGDSFRPFVTGAVWSVGVLTVCGLCFFGLTFAESRRWGIDEFLLALGVLFGICGLLSSLLIIVRLIRHVSSASRDIRDVYALTDRRAIFWSPGGRNGGIEIAMLPRGTIAPEDIRRIQYPDGSGDLHLRGLQGPGGSIALSPLTLRPLSSFLGVNDVRRVEDLVRSHLLAIDAAHPNDI